MFNDESRPSGRRPMKRLLYQRSISRDREQWQAERREDLRLLRDRSFQRKTALVSSILIKKDTFVAV